MEAVAFRGPLREHVFVVTVELAAKVDRPPEQLLVQRDGDGDGRDEEKGLEHGY